MLRSPASLWARLCTGFLFFTILFFEVRGAPATGELHEYTQPNGVKFQGRLKGDAFFHYYQTADGHPMVSDPETGWWYYTLESEEGPGAKSALRVGMEQPPGTSWKPKASTEALIQRKAANSRPSIPSVRHSPGRGGAPAPTMAHVAMFLTNFPQASGSLPVTTTPAKFQTAWFTDSTPGNPAYTARDYYREVSYGMHLLGSGPSGIQDWRTAPQSRDYYGKEDIPEHNTMGPQVQELVRWRVKDADDNNFNFGPYDTDNDGFVDIACVVFQGAAQTNTHQPADLWPIRYFLEDSTDETNPKRIYITNDVNAEGETVKVRDFIIVPELTPAAGGGFDTCTIGVFCHEYGHGIGWPDLYDYDSEGVGQWCLMSTGCNAGVLRTGDRPVWPNPWCRAMSGWVQPVNVTTPLNDYVIPEAKTENKVMRLWRNGLYETEYFLVENRGAAGWDQQLFGGGLLIWHIDEGKAGNGQQWWRIPGSPADQGLYTAGNYKVALEQSDGRFDLERKTNAGDFTDAYLQSREFSDNTVPNSRDYSWSPTNVTVTDIGLRQPDQSIRADLFVSPDHAAPGIASMNPDDGLVYYSIPSLAGTATDDAGIQSVLVALQRQSPSGDEWYDWNSSSWGPYSFFSETAAALSGPATSRSFIRGIDAAHVTPGSYVYSAKAVDTSGFEGEWRRVRFQVMPNPNAPNVVFTEPSPWENYSSGVPDFRGAVVNTGAVFTVQTALKMETGAEAGRFYHWGNNNFSGQGVFTTGNLLSLNGTPWTVLMGTRPLNQGTYTLYARVEENGVQSSWRAQAFRVGLPVRVTVTSPPHQGLAGAISGIGGRVYDPSGTGFSGGVSFTLRNPAGLYWNGSVWTGSAVNLNGVINGDTWSYGAVPPQGMLLAGTYQITASVTVQSGETSALVPGGSQTSFTVDTLPPSAAVASPLHGETVTYSPLPPFHGTLSDPGGIGYVNCYIRRNSDNAYWTGSTWTLDADHAPADGPLAAPPIAILGANYNTASGTWNCTAPLPRPRVSMENGSYNFIVIVADRAGNYVQVDSAVTLDFHQLYVWTGATLRDSATWNNSNSWDASANWSPNGVPGPEDYVELSNGDTVYNYSDRVVRGFRLNSGTLYSAEGGSLTITHDATWTGGWIGGACTNAAGASLIVSGPNNKYFANGAVFSNDGLLEWQGGGTVINQGQAGAPVTLNNRGIVRIAADGNVFSRQQANVLAVLNNLAGGRIEKTGGTGTAYSYYWTLNNDSDIFLDAGGFYPYGANVYFRNGSSLMGGGTFWLNTNLYLSTNLFATALVEFIGGSITSAGSVDRSWAGPGVLKWSTGTFYGRLTRPAGTFTQLTGPDLKILADGSEFINEGTVQWTGDGSIRGTAYTAPGPVIRNFGTFEANTPADFVRQYANVPCNFYNETGGIFVKTNPGTTHSTWRFHNAGTTSILQGWLEWHDNGDHTGSFNIATDCWLHIFRGTHNLTDGMQFSGDGNVLINGATVRAEGSIYNHLGGGVELRSGWLDESPRLRGAGPWKWTGGGMSGAIRLDSGSTLTLSGASLKEFWDDTTFDNYGTLLWQGGGKMRSRNHNSGTPLVFNNHAVLRFASAGTPLATQYADTTTVFNNLPGARVEQTADGIVYWYYWTLNNESEVSLAPGDIYFYVNKTNFLEGSLVTGGGTMWLNTEARLYCNRLHSTAATRWIGVFLSVEGATTRTWAGPGLFTWTAGTLWGSLKFESSVTAEFSGPDLKELADNSEIINDGTITWTGDGSIRARCQSGIGGIIRNRKTMIADTPADFVRQYVNVPANFYNETGATFTKRNAGTTHSTWQFHNAGTLNLEQGWLEWHSDGLHAGVFNIAADSRLHIFRGTHSLAGGTPFNGEGNVLINGATVNASGILWNNLTEGVELRSGWLELSPVLRGTGPWKWTGGGFAGNVRLDPGCTLSLSGTELKEFWDNTIFDNYGTFIWQGGGQVRARSHSSGTPLVFNNHGVFRLAADGTPLTRQYADTVAEFNNLPGARIEKTAGSGINYWYYWRLNNESEIALSAGGLYLYVNETNFRDGSAITGQGTLWLNSAVSLFAPRMHSTAAVNFLGNWLSAEGGTRTLGGPGLLTWTQGTLGGSLRREAGTVTVLEGTEQKLLADNSELINEGEMIHRGTGQVRAVAQSGTAAVIRNRPGAVFRSNTTGGFHRTYANRVPKFENAGSVEIGAGVWYLYGWNYEQMSTGALYCDVTGTGHDQIYLTTGTAIAGGSLHLRRAAGFTPPQGSYYPVLTGTTRTGTFAVITGGFAATYEPTLAKVSSLPAAETFEEWIASAGLTGPAATRNADPDGDGFDNLTEFAFKGHPALPADLIFSHTLQRIGDEDWITLHYRRWQDREQAGVVYEPGASAALDAWGLPGLIDEPDTAAPIIPNSTAWRARIRLGGIPRFLKVNVRESAASN